MAFTTTLTSDLTSTDEIIHVASNVGARSTYPWQIEIDEEKLAVTAGVEEGLDWTVLRGEEGTYPADHASGAAVLAEPLKDFYAQDDDPGAVGTESVWKHTATGGEWWRRNTANDGWDASFSPLVRATDANQADAVMYAESVDGLADASSTALAIGDGIAQAKNRAEADGAGFADAGLIGESVDGLATVNTTANATGTGDAEAGSFATSNSGTARASALAFRGADTAGMAAEIDGTSARLGFNGTTPIARPEVPASPTEQDIVDALVALGLITQAP